MCFTIFQDDNLERTMKLAKKLVLALVVCIVIFCAIFLNPYMFPTFRRDKTETFVLETIDDFDELTSTGTGTEEDPFIIQDLFFGIETEEVKEHYTLLTIKTKDLHLIIQNCTFFGGHYPIRIQGVLSGSVKITNCSIIGVLMNYGSGWASVYLPTEYGIIISNSRNISLERNIFKGEFEDVIYIEDTSNLIFSNNLIPEVTDYTLNCISNVSESIFYNNTRFGLFIRGNNNIIDSNIITTVCFLSGINVLFTKNYVSKYCNFVLVYMNNSIITNNTLIDATKSEIQASDNVTLVYNSIMNCSSYGLTLFANTSNITIYYNTFINNVQANADAQSQCSDSGISNFWYNGNLMIGNYWSDLGTSSNYTLDGSAGSVDLYPLSSPV